MMSPTGIVSGVKPCRALNAKLGLVRAGKEKNKPASKANKGLG